MKLHPIESLPLRKNQTLQSTPKIVLLLILSLIFLTIIPLFYPFLQISYSCLFKSTSQSSSSVPSSSSSSFSSSMSYDVVKGSWLRVKRNKKCDIFTGEWIRNPEAPYYTNTTCSQIHNHQNCMKYGRPDTDFLKWRWKPDECELPIFNPYQFLELLRGKSLAFVGDSVARNQLQSLICLLSRVEYPVDVSYTSNEQIKRWNYTSYNFTIVNFWTPFLVKAKEADQNGPTNTGLFSLYVDEVDEEWITQIDEFDYVIISAGHWFFRPMMFYENEQLVGCHYCLQKNITDLTLIYGYRMAFRTAFKAINSLQNFKGTTFLRTFAPAHFENGDWNKGGNCIRKKPFKSNETRLDGRDLDLYMAQLEEFRVAYEEGKKRGLKFRLLDTTQATLLRPDGHPSRYGHRPEENVTLYNDCVHWCLPGPIDSWNDMLLQMFKMEISDHQIDNNINL